MNVAHDADAAGRETKVTATARAVILVVEDEPAIRRLVVRFLGSEAEVVEAGDGRAAIDAFEADPARFDAIVCDLSLPGVTGEDVVRAVRASRPELPVLVMTGRDPESAAESLGSVGRVEWLGKPFTSAALLDAIRALTGTA